MIDNESGSAACVECERDIAYAVAIAADLQHENERLRRALSDIVNAARDQISRTTRRSAPSFRQVVFVAFRGVGIEPAKRLARADRYGGTTFKEAS